MAREMKDSGIEWLGKIPKDWMTIKGKYVFSSHKDLAGQNAENYDRLALTMNGVIKRSKEDNEGLQPTDFKGYQILRKDDLVFKLIDLQNIQTSRVGYSPYEGLVSPAYICLSCTDILPKFAEKYFLSLWHRHIFNQLGDSGVRSSLNVSDLLNLPIVFPSITEQQRIASLLDTKCAEIDKAIEATKSSIEEYKKLRQAIITEAVTKGLDPNVEMKDSGFIYAPLIPKRWHVIKITRLIDRTNNYPIGDGDHGLVGPKDYCEQGIPYIRVQNLGWGTDLITDNIVYISEDTNTLIKGSTLRPNDVLFAKTGATIGKTGIVPKEMPIANTTSHVGKITISNDYNARFIFYQLSSLIGYKQMWDFALLKTTRPELAIDEIKTMKFIVPESYETQQRIVDYLDNKCAKIDSLIKSKEKLIEELTAYRKSLIYEYVTGKKEVL